MSVEPTMGWRPIAEIEDRHIEADSMFGMYLIFGNTCNGPFYPYPLAEHAYFTAQDVKGEGVWDWFMIIPRMQRAQAEAVIAALKEPTHG